VLFAAIIALAAILAWFFLRPPNPLTMEANQVRRVEVQFEPWGEDMARLPGAASEDREAIAALVAVVRSGQETPDHKCGSRGAVVFQRSVGLPAVLRFLPGHHAEWYEFRAGGKVYRVPRAEFVAAMHQVGVEVPLECR
jgi:predicted RNA-binding Zn ribbon-like protein